MTPALAGLIRDLSLILGVIGLMTGGYFAYARNNRESRSQVVVEADKTVDLLKEQNALLSIQISTLTKQGDAREAEWKKREAEWKKREDRFEARIGELERDYRNLVLTVTTMGFCANAGACSDYNPGDRRSHQTGTLA